MCEGLLAKPVEVSVICGKSHQRKVGDPSLLAEPVEVGVILWTMTAAGWSVRVLTSVLVGVVERYGERYAHVHATPDWASKLLKTSERCGEQYPCAPLGVKILPSAPVGVGIILWVVAVVGEMSAKEMVVWGVVVMGEFLAREVVV